MKKLTITLLSVLVLGQASFAQTLAPATSEDLNDFDQQLSEIQSDAAKNNIRRESKPANFGSVVSEEAKSLKNSDPAQKKKMGEWVRDQKRKSDENPAADSQRKRRGDGDSDDRDARKSRTPSSERRK